MFTFSCACIYTHMRVPANVCTNNVCMQAQTHACMHTPSHTHACTHIHTGASQSTACCHYSFSFFRIFQLSNIVHDPCLSVHFVHYVLAFVKLQIYNLFHLGVHYVFHLFSTSATGSVFYKFPLLSLLLLFSSTGRTLPSSACSCMMQCPTCACGRLA